MKVAVVTQYFATSHQQWAGHSAYQTLRHLARRCDLHVFYPEANYPALLTPSGSRRPPLDRTWNPEGVAATYIPYPTLPLIGRPLNGYVMERRLLPHLLRFQPNVVLNYVVFPDGIAAVRLARRLRVPAVLTAIGSDLNRIPNRLRERQIQSTLARASFTITVSHDLARTARRLGADPATTLAILNGCDTSVFHPAERAAARAALGLDLARPLIVYVGRLDVRKGLIELIEAVAQLARTRSALHCVIVGDGPDRAQLVEAIARHKAGDAITLAPSCPTIDVARWMAAADLVTLPSYREGCPNVVIEALASGRPVVATNVGGIPELMDDTCGRLVPAMDVPALAGALAEVLDGTWSPEAIAAKHNRSWSDVADDVHSVLSQAVRRA